MSTRKGVHHVQPHPGFNRGGQGSAKERPLAKPQSINPTKNVELVLEPVKEFKNPCMVIVKTADYQVSTTICSPFGTTEIDKRSYVITTSTDLAYVCMENPGKPAADRRFEKAAVEEYVKAGGFVIVDDHILYKNMLTNTVIKDYDRDAHISYAKKKRDADVKERRKAHNAAEAEAGRTGMMRPDGSGKAPKPRDFDDSRFKWIDYLEPEVKPLEEAYEDFKKSDARLSEARDARKAHIAQCTTKVGSSNSVEQKEAMALRGVPVRLLPSTVTRIIMKALSNPDNYQDEDFQDSSEDEPEQSEQEQKPVGTPAIGGSTPAAGAARGNNRTPAGLNQQNAGRGSGESLTELLAQLESSIKENEQENGIDYSKAGSGVFAPIGTIIQFTPAEVQKLNSMRGKFKLSNSVKVYYQLRAGSLDRDQLLKKFESFDAQTMKDIEGHLEMENDMINSIFSERAKP